MIHASTTSAAGETIRHARTRRGLTLRALATRARTSHATISAYESGSKVPSVDTFLRLLDACDYGVEFTLRPRVRERHGLARGEELAQALKLAEQFPARPARHLSFPKLADLAP